MDFLHSLQSNGRSGKALSSSTLSSPFFGGTSPPQSPLLGPKAPDPSAANAASSFSFAYHACLVTAPCFFVRKLPLSHNNALARTERSRDKPLPSVERLQFRKRPINKNLSSLDMAPTNRILFFEPHYK